MKQKTKDQAPNRTGSQEPDLKNLVAEAMLLQRLKAHVAKRDSKEQKPG